MIFLLLVALDLSDRVILELQDGADAVEVLAEGVELLVLAFAVWRYDRGACDVRGREELALRGGRVLAAQCVSLLVGLWSAERLDGSPEHVARRNELFW